MRTICLLAMMFVLAGSAEAQPTTPWGDPDLQGVWSNQTPVPLERPKALAGKAVFTEQEAEAFERAALPRLLGVLSKQSELSGELSEIWLETQNGRVGPSRRTSLVVDPADGQIPYTPEGRRRWESLPTIERTVAGEQLGADGPEDRAEAERCLTTGGLFVPNPFYNNFHQIVQTQGYVAIITEMMHEVRIIPLDGPPLGPGIRQWLGDSRGRWEGQTLVVETRNFNDQRLFRGATREMRLVERFTRIDAETISYQLTVTDPETFSAAWTLENALRKVNSPIYEVGCHEGNYGLAGILSGARAEEKRARVSR